MKVSMRARKAVISAAAAKDKACDDLSECLHCETQMMNPS